MHGVRRYIIELHTHWMGGVKVIKDSVATDKFVIDHHGEMDIQDDIVVDGQP